MFHCFTVSLRLSVLCIYFLLAHLLSVSRMFTCSQQWRKRVKHVKHETIGPLSCDDSCFTYLWRGETEKRVYFLGMSQPLTSGEPKRSEMGHGRGLSVNPLSDAQTIRKLPWATQSDKHDGSAAYRAQLRTDPTNGAENLADMPYVNGNPDMFGPSIPLVREAAYNPPAVYPQPILRYGVDREA